MVRYAIDQPMRYQWDPDSRFPLPDPGTAPGNCGMTAVTLAAQYYTGVWRGIYATRRLGTTDLDLSTSIAEQSLALRRSGVPCHIERLTIPAIRSRVATGRWPVMVGLKMDQVPMSIAGHPFRGSHAILLRSTAVRNGQAGFLAADPNFNRTFRQDPTKGKRFFPEWVIQVAYYNAGMWALSPDKPKPLPPPPPAPTPVPEDELDAKRYLPLAICDVGQTSIYADPDRKKMLVKTWPGANDVGLYAKPRVTSGTPSPLAPVRIDRLGGPATDWEVCYVGWDRISNIRPR